MNYWLEHCEPPRRKPLGVEWDVFVSYRSLDRAWAIALYDMLTQCGYRVFVDQFVLVPGQGLASQLGKNLARSNSGVLLWSKHTSDSKWVENELDAMVARQAAAADGPDPFHFVVAALDSTPPPGLLIGKLYLDFSEYPDGPMGADIVRLTCGLQGKPLSAPQVATMSAVENKIRKEPAELRALARSERFVEILARLQGNDVAYTSSATLPSAAAEQLIRGRQYDAALAGIETALARFPSSLRLRQLQGLALRRSKRIEDAAYHLNLLLEEGHEDPETSGMLAAVYADVWAKKAAAGDARGARDALERSRSLYRQTFEKVPTDTYVGINAAAKSALLGELGLAKKLATDVLERLAEARVQRGGTPAADYWDRVTEPEALLITGDAEAALRLYHDARIAFQHETGSIESTALQVARLLAVLPVAEPTRQTLLDEFGLAS